MRNLLTILFFVVVTVSGLYSQTDVYLKVYDKTFQRMNISLYPFEGGSSRDAEVMSSRITEILKNDLWMSGFFVVNVEHRDPGNYGSDGRAAGVLARITGQFQSGGNNLMIKPTLTDAASGRAILRQEYRGASNQHRGLIHKIADDIVYSLTGEQGIATSKIASVNDSKSGSKEIVLMDYDGENRRPLTNNGSINLSPSWSPDGSQICYTSFKNDDPHLYVVNLRDNSSYRISDVQGLNSAPAWSPDGRSIALTLSKDGNAEIYLLSVSNKKLRRLTYNHAIDSSPTWSPSNREIAFTSDRTGSPQIYVMDSDGANVRRLTFQGNYNDSPMWSPRGDRIVFVSRTESGFDIYTIDVTGDNILRLTDSSGSNEDPTWSPNGFSLVFSSTRSGRKALYTMFWDGTDQKELTGSASHYLPAWSPRLK